jgi:uncharacterized membrane protein YkvA (DUF1232 family)
LLARLRAIARNVGREVRVCRLVLGDTRTPRLARVLLWAAVVYALSPIDLVPDFVPVIGQLDDVVVVPALITLGLALVPKDIVREYRERVSRSDDGG